MARVKPQSGMDGVAGAEGAATACLLLAERYLQTVGLILSDMSSFYLQSTSCPSLFELPLWRADPTATNGTPRRLKKGLPLAYLPYPPRCPPPSVACSRGFNLNTLPFFSASPT
ncbi:hypothetical protein BHE90_009985 [Fusarium euwallaceae]|uniref:Uncharacterized protein n=3 Tax=Fusarium solani species complex TaxID=232080 RepID=A0A3M2RUX8_9HYPO|nr:hypothetical protein CDV36_011278 [Fusarium kuroshium]RTE75570.1 hypothetical protein BHE90_009985 [Fusarium euwallaceae]